MNIVLAAAFFVLAPFMTFILLWLKGLPSFASPAQVLAWVYGVTWAPALLAGVLLAAVVSTVVQRTAYFQRPYDFGRCFSLGAIVGALTQASATWIYRGLTHHPFSDFWIAGAMIAGCLSGAILTPIILYWPPLRPTPKNL